MAFQGNYLNILYDIFNEEESADATFEHSHRLT